MILLALVGVAISVLALGAQAHEAGIPAWAAVLLGLASLVFGLATIANLANHPNATRSWVGGTFFELTDEPPLLAWHDWGPFFSRRVAIDDHNVRVVKKLFFGAIHAGTVHRPTSDFYRVAVSVTQHENGSRGPGYGGFSNDDGVDLAFSVASTLFAGQGPTSRGSVSASYRLSLVDRHGDEIVLLRRSDSGWDDSGESLVGRIRARLMERFGIDRHMLGSPLKKAVRIDGAFGDAPTPPAEKHVPHATCPNCHRRFALYVKTCPGCRVALFQD